MSGSTWIIASVVGLALNPFGIAPIGENCVGLGSLWFCWGSPSGRSLDISCNCDYAVVTNESAFTVTGLSASVSVAPAVTPWWQLIAVAICLVEIALVIWVGLIKFRNSRRITTLQPLEIEDAPACRPASGGEVHDRSSLVARAHRATAAAGIRLLASNSREKHL